MKSCPICRHGELAPGVVTVTLSRSESAIVIKDVPADVCDNCGEYYLTEDITRRVYTMADDAVRAGAEVEILRFAA
jgi:YgiT-type zinc finger domain-containing protein